MSSMIERVAKALHASLGYEAQWPAPECTQCMDAARAAITTMREPTEEMIKKVSFNNYVSGDGDGGCWINNEDCENIWQAMIDTALKE